MGRSRAFNRLVIGFEGVVRVLLGDMAGGGQRLVEYPRAGRRPIGGHLGRARSVLERAGEEPAGGREVPLLGGQDVDDLAVLVDGPVEVHPPSGDLDVGFVDEPPVTRNVPAGPRGVDEQWREPLDPAVDRDVVDLDATFGQ